MRWGRSSWLAVVFSAGLAVTCAIAAGSPLPRGNARGLALLARVHHAYLRVPAVSVAARLGSQSSRFTLVLRSGLVAAAQLRVGSGPNALLLVASGPGTATFERRPGMACWSKVAASRSLAMVGLRFPDQLRMRVSAPRRVANAWRMPVAGDGGPYTFVVDAKSFLLRSMIVRAPGQRPFTESVTSLGTAPRLSAPSPHC